jgi:hypothetical protein
VLGRIMTEAPAKNIEIMGKKAKKSFSFASNILNKFL